MVASVKCASRMPIPPGSTFTPIANGVIVHYVAVDFITCTFTNSPLPPVGGVVMPVNALVLISPWLAVIGVVASIGTVAVVVKRRRP